LIICRLSGSGGSYHLDVYLAYRSWCTENGLRAVSIEDLDKALDALHLVANRQNFNGIESVCWLGIELLNDWQPEDFWSFDPFEDEINRESPQLKEYSEMDEDDDLSEVVF
jgi:hypothetical protein